MQLDRLKLASRIDRRLRDVDSIRRGLILARTHTLDPTTTDTELMNRITTACEKAKALWIALDAQAYALYREHGRTE